MAPHYIIIPIIFFQLCRALSHDTAGSGDLELVELLISLGLSIEDQSRNGWDVFLWACLGGHAAVVSKLLSLGSNIGVKDKEERLGLHWAAEKGHAEAVGVLVRDMLQANLDIQATVSSCELRFSKRIYLFC